MVATPFIELSQTQIFSIAGGEPDVRISQVQIYALIRYPTEALEISGFQNYAVVGSDNDMEISQVQIYVVCKRRAENPIIRAFTFTLDNHDYYVLRLADGGTLVYDTYSEQWVEYANLGLPYWRANIGLNWIGAEALAHSYGSNIIVGDDTYGLLWFLGPEQPYDDHPLDSEGVEYFDRVTMGQVPMRGRQVVPCNAVWLTTDMGEPAYGGAGVTLYYSDDGGKSFNDAGIISITSAEYRPELMWRSLGQIAAPGRLFRIEDDGAVVRIDGLEMNDPDNGG